MPIFMETMLIYFSNSKVVVAVRSVIQMTEISCSTTLRSMNKNVLLVHSRDHLTRTGRDLNLALRKKWAI